MEKFNTSSITELDLDDGTARLVLRKERPTAPPSERTVPVPVSGETTGGKSVRPGIPATPNNGETISSPIVGTFYASPSPDAPPFVKPGAKVKTGQTLCILEAMKMMNHLEAEFDCEIIEVLAGSGDMVEYGQNLFTVKRL